MSTSTTDWLLTGDPVIRWQTMKDLLDAPREAYERERAKTVTEGWVARFLERQDSPGHWPEGRWTGAPWILLTLIECGVPSEEERCRLAASLFLDRMLPPGDEQKVLDRVDLCHIGFWLMIGAYFTPEDPRLPDIAETLLKTQMSDGGWNCNIRKKPTRHSSFHTTFNVLEGLREAATAAVLDDSSFRSAESAAVKFSLDHRLYRSDKSGEIISEKFTHLTYPSYWHYNVLRALDYLRITPSVRDSRLDDPIALLESQRLSGGLWPSQKRIAGIIHFDMEQSGKPSRWNTLRALRVLRARGSGGKPHQT